MNRLSPVAAASILGLVLAMSSSADLRAAELKVVAGGSLVPLFKELGPQFEKASGHKLSIHFDSTPSIIARVAAGTPFDAVIVPFDVFKDNGGQRRASPPARQSISPAPAMASSFARARRSRIFPRPRR